jgi:hypothetical protein
MWTDRVVVTSPALDNDLGLTQWGIASERPSQDQAGAS